MSAIETALTGSRRIHTKGSRLPVSRTWSGLDKVFGSASPWLRGGAGKVSWRMGGGSGDEVSDKSCTGARTRMVCGPTITRRRIRVGGNPCEYIRYIRGCRQYDSGYHPHPDNNKVFQAAETDWLPVETT